MKRLTTLGTLLLVFSLSASAKTVDVRPDARERIEELVVKPLQDRGRFWQIFSRALIPVEPPELRLWTSAPKTDKDGRSFVAFRVRQVDAQTTSVPTLVDGCYYPGVDAAYLAVEYMNTHVAVDQHPMLTMEMPKQLKAGGSLFRATD